MAIRYGKGLIGGAVVVALLALLVHWIGIDTIEHYRDDLLFYLQAHLMLVLASMLAALVVGIPAGIFLSRPTMVGRAGCSAPRGQCRLPPSRSGPAPD